MTFRLTYLGRVLATVDQSPGHDADLAAAAFELAVHDRLKRVHVEREDGARVCTVVMPDHGEEQGR